MCHLFEVTELTSFFAGTVDDNERIAMFEEETMDIQFMVSGQNLLNY